MRPPTRPEALADPFRGGRPRPPREAPPSAWRAGTSSPGGPRAPRGRPEHARALARLREPRMRSLRRVPCPDRGAAPFAGGLGAQPVAPLRRAPLEAHVRDCRPCAGWSAPSAPLRPRPSGRGARGPIGRTGLRAGRWAASALGPRGGGRSGPPGRHAAPGRRGRAGHVARAAHHAVPARPPWPSPGPRPRRGAGTWATRPSSRSVASRRMA